MSCYAFISVEISISLSLPLVSCILNARGSVVGSGFHVAVNYMSCLCASADRASFVIVEVKSPDFQLPIGECKVEREGSDVTLVSFSRGVHTCLEAAKELEAQGVSCEVINIRTLRPLDRKTIINSVMKTNRMVTVEEVRLASLVCLAYFVERTLKVCSGFRAGHHAALALSLEPASMKARLSII